MTLDFSRATRLFALCLVVALTFACGDDDSGSSPSPMNDSGMMDASGDSASNSGRDTGNTDTTQADTDPTDSEIDLGEDIADITEDTSSPEDTDMPDDAAMDMGEDTADIATDTEFTDTPDDTSADDASTDSDNADTNNDTASPEDTNMPDDATADLGEDMPDAEDAGMDTEVPNDAGDVATDVEPDVSPDVEPDVAPDVGEPEVVGQLNVTWWQEDALFDFPEVYAHGVFSQSIAELGVEDVVGWSRFVNGWDLFLDDGYWSLPELEEWSFDDPPTLAAEPAWMDAGLFLGIGDFMNAHISEELEEDENVLIYDMLLEEASEAALQQDPTAAMDLFISGGDDIATGLFPEAVSLPPVVEITNHDPRFEIPLRYGRPLIVEWVPSNDPEDTMVITIEGAEDLVVWHTADDGNADLGPVIEEANLFLGDTPVFSVARLRQREVSLPEGRLKVASTTKQWLYGRTVGPYTIKPNQWHTGTTTTVTVESWDAPFTSNPPRIELGPDIIVEGAEMIDTEGHRLQLTLQIPLGATSGPRAISVGGTEEAPLLDLPEGAWVIEPLEHAGDCLSALDEGPIPDGAYTATTAGLLPGTFTAERCALGDPEGAEQAIPIHLDAGQTLNARLLSRDLFGVIYLADSCGAPESVFLCEEAPDSIRRPIPLTYTAEQDEDLLLVVDSYGQGTGEYTIDIQRSAPAPFTIFPATYTGGSVVVELLSLIEPFDPNTITLDMGEGITVTELSVDEFEPEFAIANIRVASSAPIGKRDATVQIGQQLRVAQNAFEVIGFAAGSNACESADVLTPLTSGRYEGFTELGGFNNITPIDCLGEDSEGQELIFRVDLGPGETLEAMVEMPDNDAVVYIVQDCEGTTLACADNADSGRPEVISWTGPDTASTIYLVVDGFSFEDVGSFKMQIEIIY